MLPLSGGQPALLPGGCDRPDELGQPDQTVAVEVGAARLRGFIRLGYQTLAVNAHDEAGYPSGPGSGDAQMESEF